MTPTLDPELDEQATGQATEAPSEDFGPLNRNLPGQLKEAILEAIRRAQREEKWLRRMEVLQDSMHRLYDKNIQHFYQRGTDYIAAIPGSIYTNNGQQESFGTYIDDYNIFTEALMIQRAKLTESAPGIDFQPCDPKDPADTEAASAAEAMKVDFDRSNDVKALMDSIYYHYQMGGRVVVWTRTEEGTFAPSRSGTPQRSGKATAYGCLESKIPLMAEDVKSLWYCGVYEDIYVRSAKTDYPWIAKKLKNGPCLAEGEYERFHRLQVLRASSGSADQLQADATANLVTEGHFWLRQAAFEEEEKPYKNENGDTETIEDEDGERSKMVREKILELFPAGVHAHVIGDQYCGSWNELLESRVSISKAYIGKGQSSMPIAAPAVIAQDRFNTARNKIAETQDFGDGSTYFAGTKQEFDSLTKQKSQPAALRHIKEVASGMKASDLLYQEKTLEVTPSQTADAEFLFGPYIQYILSIPPAVWGQQMPDQQTKGGYELASAQAMGILGVFWMKASWLLACIYVNNCLAVMDDAEYPDEITVTIKGKTTIVRKESLSKGNFRACPDTDSGFPESTSAKRASTERLVGLLAQTPLAMQFFGSPDNIATINRQYGMPELVLPEAEARDKQLWEIEELLSESPVLSPDIAAMLNGAPAGVGPDGQPTPAQPQAQIPDILKAIQAAIMAGQAQQQAAQQELEIEHAAATVSATAQGGGAAPPPTAAPAAPPFDPLSVARSSVPVLPPDFHAWEAMKCQDWLSTPECRKELTIGRPQPGDESQEPQPNIAGVLNVILHWMEHTAAAPTQPPPPNGPLTAPPPQGGAPPAAPPTPGAELPAGM
jgi:hypothetical protein